MAIEHIKDLTSDPRNARRHNPRNVGMIETALGEVGAARSIVIDEDGVVLAGNATIEAAAQAGIERVQVVEADGNTIIAVRRSGLTEEQKAKLALYDNRAAELADWDAEVLAALSQEIDLSTLFRDDELAALLAAPVDIGGAGDEFDTTPEDGPTRTQVGELWEIGPHRLLVGDCTDPANVERLMGGERLQLVWTDPPYGVNHSGGSKDPRSSTYRSGDTLQNDNLTEDQTEMLVTTAFTIAAAHGTAGASLYAAVPAVPLHRRFIEAMNNAGFTYRHGLVWVKDTFVFGRSDYHYRHEHILYGWKDDGAHYFIDDRKQDSVFEIARPKNSDDHPTQKPLELVSRMVENSARIGDIVYDPFLGSGTTLIAAHQTGRRCYGMEISPRYADVILRRAEAAGLSVARRDE